MKPFPLRLRRLLDETGTTQSALAAHLGIARQSCAAYCDGSSSPTWEGIVKIAKFFDCSTDYLLGLSDSREQRGDSDSKRPSVRICPLIGGVPCAKERCAVYRNGRCLIPMVVEEVEQK